MTGVQVVVPDLGLVDARTLVAAWADEAPTVRPFAEDTLAFAIAYGRALAASDVARQHPEVRALAFWLREAPLRELQRAFEAGQPDEVVPSPRGTVFHIPPGNVDTVFVYSWLLAALVGNRNLVRLPSSGGDVVDALAAVAGEVLAEERFAGVRARTRLVHYGHDAGVTAAFSAAADVRVLWGGDASVLALRAGPAAAPRHRAHLPRPLRVRAARRRRRRRSGRGRARSPGRPLRHRRVLVRPGGVLVTPARRVARHRRGRVGCLEAVLPRGGRGPQSARATTHRSRLCSASSCTPPPR